MTNLRSSDGLTSATALAALTALLCCVALLAPGVARRLTQPGEDAAAKRRLVAAAVRLERCRLESPDPRGCAAAAGGDAGVEVLETGYAGYRVRARSRSGATFAITRVTVDGTAQRACEPTGAGGCPPDGTW